MSQKPLVLPDIRSRAGAFVAQWRDAEGYERGEAQSFVRDLLRVFGITRSRAAVYEEACSACVHRRPGVHRRADLGDCADRR